MTTADHEVGERVGRATDVMKCREKRPRRHASRNVTVYTSLSSRESIASPECWNTFSMRTLVGNT